MQEQLGSREREGERGRERVCGSKGEWKIICGYWGESAGKRRKANIAGNSSKKAAKLG